MALDREALLARVHEVDRLCGQETAHIYTVIRKANSINRDLIEELVDPDPPGDSPPPVPPPSPSTLQRF